MGRVPLFKKYYLGQETMSDSIQVHYERYNVLNRVCPLLEISQLYMYNIIVTIIII